MVNDKVMTPDLNDLYYYVQVVDNGGFAQAGRALGIPKSKLSRRIALLEERLGVRLIQRSSRSFQVTELGLAYLARCRAMLVEAEAAQSLIDSTRTEPCGVVRLSCPIDLLHTKVSKLLVAFALQYPRISVQLVGVNRAVDLVSEGLDVAIRVRPLPLEDSELAMRVLGYASQCLLASPALLARHGEPGGPADLLGWPSLGHGSTMEGHRWQLLGPEGAEVRQHHSPRFVTTDMQGLRQAAIEGLGVVQLPVMMVQEALDNGSLRHLLPGWAPRQEVIHAVFPSRRGLLPSVRALIDHLALGFAPMAKP